RASQAGLTTEQASRQAEESEVRCPDPESSGKMVERIREAKHKGDTLGGVFEVVVTNPPIGLGSYAQWDRRLTTRLAMALMSIQAMKGVEVGMGFEAARRFGSEVHDEIFYDPKTGFIRGSNNAGGLEGGITTGQPIVLRTAMKPLSTLYTPKKSVDILTKEPLEPTIERSDICMDLAEHSYEVIVQDGLLDRIGEFLVPFKLGPQTVVVTNPVVKRHYGARVVHSLRAVGLKPTVLALPDGERTKSLKSVAMVL